MGSGEAPGSSSIQANDTLRVLLSGLIETNGIYCSNRDLRVVFPNTDNHAVIMPRGAKLSEYPIYPSVSRLPDGQVYTMGIRGWWAYHSAPYNPRVPSWAETKRLNRAVKDLAQYAETEQARWVERRRSPGVVRMDVPKRIEI